MLSQAFIELGGGWEQYESDLGSKLGREVRRRLRRLEESGDVELEVLSGGDRLEELLAEGFGVEASGWKGRDGTAIASHPRTVGFYSSLARWAETRGELRLSFLRLDGRAIAFNFALEAYGVFHSLKSGYLQEAARLGPSQVHRYLMIQRAFQQGLTRYRFVGPSAQYKDRWATHWEELLELQAFSRRPRGLAHWVLDRYCKPVARRARASIISRRASH